MDFLSMQFMTRYGYMMLWHAKIVSGEYKNRKIYHGTDGPEFTDEEKLADAVNIMKRHVEILNELAECRAENPIK